MNDPAPRPTASREETVETHPEALLRIGAAAAALMIILVLASLLVDAPLEGPANPLLTPNPAKAPWYFLGLQELLHYFPPVVAGVLIPGLVVMGLIVIPYFRVNIEADGFWLTDRSRKLAWFFSVTGAICAMLIWFAVYPVLATTLLTAVLMLAAIPRRSSYLRSKPLSFWIMSWFLLTSVVLTVIGTYFRGAGWGWVLPWSQP